MCSLLHSNDDRKRRRQLLCSVFLIVSFPWNLCLLFSYISRSAAGTHKHEQWKVTQSCNTDFHILELVVVVVSRLDPTWCKIIFQHSFSHSFSSSLSRKSTLSQGTPGGCVFVYAVIQGDTFRLESSIFRLMNPSICQLTVRIESFESYKRQSERKVRLKASSIRP